MIAEPSKRQGATSLDSLQSLPGMLLESCRKWGAKPALLHKVRGQYEPISYSSLLTHVHETASGFATCGVTSGSTVAIMAENCVEWAICDWAALSLGAIVVPIYPTLMPDTVGYILKDANASMVISGDVKTTKKIEEALQCQNLSVVVVQSHHGNALSLPRLVEDGRDHGISFEEFEAAALKVRPEDTATIIYTSGTTGEPKGAVLQHRAFTFLCNAILENLPVDHRDRFLSFLPLSHVYERMAGHFLPISSGAEIAYAESLRTLAQDILSTKPTIILAVPRFLDSVRDKVCGAVREAPWFKKKLFEVTLSRGHERLRNKLKPVGFLGGWLDNKVGKKFRARFGGRLRFFVSGGAALPLDLAEFFGAFGMPVVQGYGLTETAPVISVNHPARNRPDSVGEVLTSVDVRIADDGEILMRGPNLMTGYYNKPQETADVIDDDGWFHTGDIGRMEGKRLWITDRKKDIIVMANGKNVAPLAIENKLKGSPYIEEAMVIGDSMDYIAALIVPSFETLRHYCHKKSLDTSHHRDTVEYADVKALIKAEVDKVNQTLPDYERVKRHHIVNDPWTQDTGELTPTLKVKRAVVKDKFADAIRTLQS